MSTDLLRPPATLTPSEALHRSQQAPTILANPTISIPWPLSLLTTSDAPEKWTIYENLFYSCLRTGDNRSATLALSKMKERFGDVNERVMGLTGLYHEAVAQEDGRLSNLLEQYKEAVEDMPINMVMKKRRIALLRNVGKSNEAISALVELLDISPTDAEAWAELADLYFVQGSYEKAVYCLEEVLLVMPNAWNMHAKLGEVLYVAASAAPGGERLVGLVRTMKTFCRSIELCDDFLRGFYGLKLTTNELKEAMSSSGDVNSAKRALEEDGSSVPPLTTIEKLNELSTKKLVEIVRKSSSSDYDWEGYAEAEVIAARELLDRDSSKTPR